MQIVFNLGTRKTLHYLRWGCRKFFLPPPNYLWPRSQSYQREARLNRQVFTSSLRSTLSLGKFCGLPWESRGASSTRTGDWACMAPTPLPGYPDRNRASPPARPARRSQAPPRKPQEPPPADGQRPATGTEAAAPWGWGRLIHPTPLAPRYLASSPRPSSIMAAAARQEGGRRSACAGFHGHHPAPALPGPRLRPARPGPVRPPLAAELRAQLPRRRRWLREGRRPRPLRALGARHTPVLSAAGGWLGSEPTGGRRLKPPARRTSAGAESGKAWSCLETKKKNIINLTFGKYSFCCTARLGKWAAVQGEARNRLPPLRERSWGWAPTGKNPAEHQERSLKKGRKTQPAPPLRKFYLCRDNVLGMGLRDCAGGHQPVPARRRRLLVKSHRVLGKKNAEKLLEVGRSELCCVQYKPTGKYSNAWELRI